MGAAAAEPPHHFVGLGLRGLARDPTSAVVVARVKLLDVTLVEDHASALSLRPKVLVGDNFEARLPLTFGLFLTDRVYPFVGVGGAYNTDDYGHLDLMYSFGADFELRDRLSMSVYCNLIYQDEVPDRDTELIVTVNLAF
jgi:hypothetical protein